MIGVVSGELVAFEKNKNNPCEHLPIGKINVNWYWMKENKWKIVVVDLIANIEWRI